ncbi:serine/threonine-protein kinase [Wenzhouxiangella marina]|uniref:Protein kinase domain-containing protein n=1 Tax=Wenzhouxiangella marina TaxID=1579979 RepID=A0A0K0XVH0_9GAMM|nr:serine/threonine-protein kinase [Wenzhouxiangella marina]AKS41616.1 hypothetical protein WM2015_1242 [Wenzhouxiangella marina]MBB6086625.1 non-specific serine/threonine protein kinase/serine/threonine-protein kinase [Wenzhouxiangella marina]
MSDARRPRGGRLTPVRRRLLDRLFDQALELPPEERGDYVERCLLRAPRLAFWLERLLAAGAQPTAFVDQSARHLVGNALAERTDLFPRTLVRGTRMGPWRILARIGAGGMGEVYHAERADGAFRMQVAIKLIRSRRENLARLLETERELLARLNHPCIARLIDGGLAEDGRPYLVMEWVDGRTLGEWIHGSDVNAARCLDVFAGVCEAVAFAHRALVVHGDIKPANVAVSRDDQVKLLDFGVAQLMDVDTDARLPSALTPGFAAPEQLAGEPVSTASDIYSLGAVLRWMVHSPPDKDDPDGQPRLREAWRGFHRLADLQAVIDQATADSPDQRYPTVNALLLELDRLTSDRPVRARRLSLPGVVRLWARRRRWTALFGGLGLIALVAGVSGLVWQARIVAQERDVARHEADVTLAVKDRLIVLFREASQLSGSEELSARQLLDETVIAAEEWLQNDPETLIEIRLALAEILIALDDWASAEPLLAQSVAEVRGDSSPVLLAKLKHGLAQVRHRQGRVEEGFELADEAVELIDSLSGEHPERLASALQTRGALKRLRGDWDGAVADLQRSRTLASEASAGPRPMMAWAESNLAATYLVGGRLEEAVEHMERAEALWTTLGRGESPDALTNLQNLAAVLDRLGRSEEAARRFERIIELRRSRLGESAALAASMTQLGRLLLVRGDLERGRELIDEALVMMERFVGPDTVDYASTLFGVGELKLIEREPAAAAAAFARAKSIFTRTVGAEHPYTRVAQLGEDRALAISEDAGDQREAVQRLTATIDKLRDAGPVAETFLARGLCERAVLGVRLSLPSAAEDATECLRLRQARSLGGWRELEALALVQLTRQQFDELAVSVERMAEIMYPEHPRVVWLRQF